MIRRRTFAFAAVAAMLAFGVGPGQALADPAPGSLQQLAAPNGCISEIALGFCSTGRMLDEFKAMAMSPDSQFIYGVASGSVHDAACLKSCPTDTDGVSILHRDPTTGIVNQLPGTDGCVSNNGTDGRGGACATVAALKGAKGIAISPDGKHVYVAENSGLVGFSRNQATGVLTPDAGCVERTTANGCSASPIANDATNVVVSHDGKNVWMLGSTNPNPATDSAVPDAIATLGRNPDTGVLTQVPLPAGCISHQGTGAFAGANICRKATALWEPLGLVEAFGGQHAYAAAAEGIPAFCCTVTGGGNLREPGSITALKIEDDGTLTQIDCNGISATRCGSTGYALTDAKSIAITRDGKSVYVAGEGGAGGCCGTPLPGTVSVFTRDAASGKLTENQCFSEDGSDGNGTAGVCSTARNVQEPSGIAVGRDQADVYVASSDGDGPTVFGRDTGNGLLSQLPGADGCLQDQGLEGCGHADLAWTNAVVTSPGCDFVYFGGHDDAGYYRDGGKQPPDNSSITSYSRANDCTPVSAATFAPCSKTSPDIVFSVTDRIGDNGAKRLHYKVDGGAEQVAPTGAGVTGTVTLNFNLPEGKHTLEYWGEDQAYAVEHAHHTADVVVDRTNPTVSIKSDQNTNIYFRNDYATITVTASDAISGLKTDPSSKGEKIPTGKSGDFTIKKTAVDNCGNSATASFKYTVGGQLVLAGATKKLKLTISPRVTTVGKKTVFSFRVTHLGKPVAAATIRFAGKRVRSDRRGRATTTATLPQLAVYGAQATKRGYQPGSTSARTIRSTKFTG